jgi:PKD repeat protein
MHNRMKAFAYLVTCLTTVALSGCVAHQTEAPSLSGPSAFALSMSVTASPESINYDGSSQSRVTISAIGPDGRGKASLPIRVDMAVRDSSGSLVPQDFGTLSARSVVTNTDGRAFVVYTAPPSPAGGATETCYGVPGTCVSIVATPSDSGTGNFATAQPVIGTIRLVPPGVILPPAGTPKAAFTFLPESGILVGNTVNFDASASCPTDPSGVCSSSGTIVSYAWNFGDGATGGGVTTTHVFSTSGQFVVTLTVTTDRGISASTSKTINVGLPAAPLADFVFSPAAPVAGQTVFFNADISKSTPGHNITQFNWSFGDGTTASGITVSHIFEQSGVYAVVLSVLDDTGQKSTKNVSLTIGGSNPTATFVASVTNAATHTMTFDASGSTAVGGATITSYQWAFGDGQFAGPSSTPTVTHPYAGTGSVTVRVTVTDSAGRTGTFSASVSVP